MYKRQQHIPPRFSAALAERLNELCEIEVREARDGDVLEPGLALIAPGDYHMDIRLRRDRYEVVLNQEEREHHQRPAVERLFRSISEHSAEYTVAGILTGMGKDGAAAMKTLRDKGAWTIGQDEAPCVVYGMPGAAAKLDAVEEEVPLSQFAKSLCEASVSQSAKLGTRAVVA